MEVNVRARTSPFQGITEFGEGSGKKLNSVH